MFSYIILFLIFLLFVGHVNAGYFPAPTPEYAQYILTAQIVISILSLVVLILINYKIISYFSEKRKWTLFFQNKLILSFYIVVMSGLSHFFIYLLLLPNEGSIINLYSNPIMLLLLPLAILNVYSIVGIIISTFLNNYVFGLFMKKKNFSDAGILLLLQLPFVGALVIYLLTSVYYFIYPFTGVKFTSLF